jgi:hypothetical protein
MEGDLDAVARVLGRMLVELRLRRGTVTIRMRSDTPSDIVLRWETETGRAVGLEHTIAARDVIRHSADPDAILHHIIERSGEELLRYFNKAAV